MSQQAGTAAEQGLVSVVIPAYNVAEHIGEAIASVRAQSCPQLEIIVVDDGSKDGSAELVEREHPDVRLFRKENGGAASARNLGMREARGEYVAFLDADDVWLPGKLEVQIAYLRARPQVGLVCSGFSHWEADADGHFPDPQARYPEPPGMAVDSLRSGWIYHKLLLDNFVWTSTVLMRRSLIEKIGYYDESLRLGQDYEYWLRAARDTEIHRLAGIMALYRKHRGSATVRGADVNYAARVVAGAVERWGLASPNGESITQEAFRERLSRIHFMMGYGHYQRGNASTALREFLACAKLRPAHVKSWAYVLLAGARSLTRSADR